MFLTTLPSPAQPGGHSRNREKRKGEDADAGRERDERDLVVFRALGGLGFKVLCPGVNAGPHYQYQYCDTGYTKVTG
jgi:hypothetical protein